MNKKYFILIALILIASIVISAEDLLGGEANGTTKVDLVLPPETKTTLENLSTKIDSVCIREDTNCLEYECLERDEKTGECLKLGEKCLQEEKICLEYGEIETIIGITDVNVFSKGCDEKECCYDIISEPLMHRYNTCLSPYTAVLDFVKQDLENLAKEKQAEQNKANKTFTDNLEITIK